MAIIAPTFDFMKVSPGDDALLYNFLSDNGGIDPTWGNKLKVTASGLTAKVDTGMVIIKGRMIKNDAPLNVAIPPNSSGHIVVTIDLTKQNEFTGTPGDDNYKPVNNQVRIERVASLVQQDILNGGNIYMFELATYTSNGSTITLKETSPNTTGKKNGTALLFSGPAKNLNETITPKLPLVDFKVIIVYFSAWGRQFSCTLDRRPDGSFTSGQAGGINLSATEADKTWSMHEAQIDVMPNGTLKMTRSKQLSSTGYIAWGARSPVRVERIIGIRSSIA